MKATVFIAASSLLFSASLTSADNRYNGPWLNQYAPDGNHAAVFCSPPLRETQKAYVYTCRGLVCFQNSIHAAKWQNAQPLNRNVRMTFQIDGQYYNWGATDYTYGETVMSRSNEPITPNEYNAFKSGNIFEPPFATWRNSMRNSARAIEALKFFCNR